MLVEIANNLTKGNTTNKVQDLDIKVVHVPKGKQHLKVSTDVNVSTYLWEDNFNIQATLV